MCFDAKMQSKNKSAQSPRKTAPNRKRSDPLLLRVENMHILLNKVFDWINGLRDISVFLFNFYQKHP